MLIPALQNSCDAFDCFALCTFDVGTEKRAHFLFTISKQAKMPSLYLFLVGPPCSCLSLFLSNFHIFQLNVPSRYVSSTHSAGLHIAVKMERTCQTRKGRARDQSIHAIIKSCDFYLFFLLDGWNQLMSTFLLDGERLVLKSLTLSKCLLDFSSNCLVL